MKMKGKCTGPKYRSKMLGKWVKRHLGGHDLVRRVDRQGQVLIWCKRCSGYARQKMGPKLMKLLQAGASGHKRVRQDVKTDSTP